MTKQKALEKYSQHTEYLENLIKERYPFKGMPVKDCYLAILKEKIKRYKTKIQKLKLAQHG